MRRPLSYIFAALGGSAIGLSSALWMAGLFPGINSMAFGNLNIEGWHGDAAIGSTAADPYTRARVARHGLLAMAKSEAMYFTTAVDRNGRPLREECIYRLAAGPTFPAQWWSVTLYTADSWLPLNNDNALSINAAEVQPEPDGLWEAFIAPTRPADARYWISSRNAGTFNLTLRLYVPNDAMLTSPGDTLAPPSVQLVSCGGKAT